MTLVTTNGTFDILHVGHIRLLEFAKELGDRLVVGLNSDISVKAYKSKFRPIISQGHRKEMLEAIKYVDEVIIFDEPDCRAFLDRVKPDIHVKSKNGYTGIEGETVEGNGGILVLYEDAVGCSTTKIIERGARSLALERQVYR